MLTVRSASGSTTAWIQYCVVIIFFFSFCSQSYYRWSTIDKRIEFWFRTDNHSAGGEIDLVHEGIFVPNNISLWNMLIFYPRNGREYEIKWTYHLSCYYPPTIFNYNCCVFIGKSVNSKDPSIKVSRPAHIVLPTSRPFTFSSFIFNLMLSKFILKIGERNIVADIGVLGWRWILHRIRNSVRMHVP